VFVNREKPPLSTLPVKDHEKGAGSIQSGEPDKKKAEKGDEKKKSGRRNVKRENGPRRPDSSPHREQG